MTLPLAANTGLSEASPSAVVSGRIISSSRKSTVTCLPLSKRTAFTVTISSSKRFASRAADAFFWLSSANASWSSREIL